MSELPGHHNIQYLDTLKQFLSSAVKFLSPMGAPSLLAGLPESRKYLQVKVLVQEHQQFCGLVMENQVGGRTNDSAQGCTEGVRIDGGLQGSHTLLPQHKLVALVYCSLGDHLSSNEITSYSY